MRLSDGRKFAKAKTLVDLINGKRRGVGEAR